jgi:hypothetical protein
MSASCLHFCPIKTILKSLGDLKTADPLSMVSHEGQEIHDRNEKLGGDTPWFSLVTHDTQSTKLTKLDTGGLDERNRQGPWQQVRAAPAASSIAASKAMPKKKAKK